MCFLLYIALKAILFSLIEIIQCYIIFQKGIKKMKLLYQSALVSIIIPVYKVEQYLNDSVESALNQTYSNIEIILVNDGSPDRCPQICDELANKYNKVQVIHKVNGGLSDARNAGIKKANGEFILFLDSDDTLVSNALEGLVSKALETNTDMVIPDRYIQVKENVETKRKIFHFSNSEYMEDPISFAINVMIDKGRAWRAHSLLYRASIIKENNIIFPVGYISEDIVFNLVFMSKCNKLSFYPGETVNYLKRAGSITTSFQENFFNSFLFIDETIKKFLVESNVDNESTNKLRNQLLCKNITSYVYDLFSRKCDWDKDKKLLKAQEVMGNPRVNDAFNSGSVNIHYTKITSSSYLKHVLFSIIFKQLKKRNLNQVYRISSITDSLRKSMSTFKP
jgi:glycosyltransferase involved in cell wall biosynthesis